MTPLLLRIIAVLFVTVLQLEAVLPKAYDEYVNDYGQVLSPSTVKAVREQLYSIEKSSGVEITVVTIRSSDKYGTFPSWEGFATALFNHWGIGNKKQNNGVMLLISRDERRVRIELGAGYPDHYNQIVKEIIDNTIVPALKNDDYNAAVFAGVTKIIDVTTRKVSFWEFYKWPIIGGVAALLSIIAALYARATGKTGVFWGLLSLGGIIIFFVLKFLMLGRRSSGHGGGSSRGGGASGSF